MAAPSLLPAPSMGPTKPKWPSRRTRTYVQSLLIAIALAVLVLYYMAELFGLREPQTRLESETVMSGNEGVEVVGVPEMDVDLEKDPTRIILDDGLSFPPEPTETTIPIRPEPPHKPLIQFKLEEYDTAPPFAADPLSTRAPVPFTLTSNPSFNQDPIDWWSDPTHNLLRSFVAASNSLHKFRPPECEITPRHLQRYAPIINSTSTIFFALNLKNNENVSPSFLQSFITLMPLLGPERFFVSIAESASTEQDWTPTLIRLMGRLLDTFGVRYRLMAQGHTYSPNKNNGHRITALAEVRNLVLEPLYNDSPLGEFDTVLFMNDVVHCPSDILEVLYQHYVQGADMTCSVDWENYRIYDRWVTRAMTGRPYYKESEIIAWWGRQQKPPMPPLLEDPTDKDAKERVEAYLPTQVFSCWNGMAAIDARAFYPPNNIRFREAYNDPYHSDKVSECLLLPIDMWKVQMGKIQLAPRAAVAYSMDWYLQYRSDLPGLAPDPEVAYESPQAEMDMEHINWAMDPPENIVYLDGNAGAAWRWAPWDEA